MSKKNNNDNILRVQFVEPKHSEFYDPIKFFEKVYGKPKRADNLRFALKDFKTLFDLFNVRTFEGLIKKLKVQIK